MYDLTVIGAGWAGFNAAIKAKELGLNTCLIEKSQIGGTCLNLGCIPTKSLIQSAKVFALAKKSQNFGLEAIGPKIDFLKVQKRKEGVIAGLQKGMQFMLKGIDYLDGEAKIISNEEIKVGKQTIKTKFMLIASGSRPVELSKFKFNSKNILSSDEMLNLKEIPDSLLIIGGGVIGCEFASLFSTLGSKVTIVEKMAQLIPGEDKEIARKIETVFKKKGIKVSTNTDASSVDLKDFSLTLVCVGRVPVSDGLGLEKIGLNLDRGKIQVDEYLRTNISNLYAAGDCTGKTMLAHFAAYQGEIAAYNIVNPGNPKKADNANIPNCIFTDPEIASVGLSEDKARGQGIDIAIKRFDFLGSGMALILDERDGFIKIIADKNSQELLGGCIIGPRATELISALTIAISSRLKIPDIQNTIFAHPTLSESIHEALK
jgi:dihydrolipoamide dehydrogenase